MAADLLTRLLRQVQDGAISPEAARAEILSPGADAPVGEFAKVDLQRAERCGAPEVVFGQGKTATQIAAILNELVKHGQPGLATRVSAEVGEVLTASLPGGRYNPVSRTFHYGEHLAPAVKSGKVVVVTAGTSDLPVAEEAREVASAWGCEVTLLVDVGVAGLHRLLSRLDVLGDADALVVVAGMEGALPSVVGGLVDCPVIAVPTSIGYGASLGGLAALLGMLNSCASNVTVVNIDSGFNGGYVAGLIARRAAQSRAR
jgi:pyridinium-3,5-biscarboxylic acid mononucleotide synthase